MDYEYKKDIAYKSVNGVTLYLDCLTSKNLEKPAPCVIWFHGGGWQEGGKSDISGIPFLAPLLLEAGIGLVSAQYRLVGKDGGGFPQSIEDAADAVDFVKTLPFADEKKLFTGGISAGAYLALETALQKKEVRGALSFSGIYYMRGNDGQFNALSVPAATQGFIDNFLGKTANACCNPSGLLQNGQPKPSIFMAHGSCDECANVKSADLFYERAEKLGYNIDYIKIQNSNHTFGPVGGRTEPSIRTVMQRACDFVQKCSYFPIEF